jgi:lipopolysaccharide/colanic/teichoic acid biosynthesis glycosyltransferase
MSSEIAPSTWEAEVTVGSGRRPTMVGAPAVQPGPGAVILALSGDRTPGGYERFVKPAVDRTAAAVLLLFLVPVLLLVALAVWSVLGRPILLRQQRVGQGGREFHMYKFRSMHPCRRTRRGPYDGPDRRRTHKHPDDPRLVGVGRFLRKWSLDELPQLLNILRGEMSFVGPRPEMAQIVERYEPWQHRRHDVRPGLTGLWQVTERNTVMHEHVDVDLAYIDKLSFRTDLRIMVRTLPAALGMLRGF